MDRLNHEHDRPARQLAGGALLYVEAWQSGRLHRIYLRANPKACRRQGFREAPGEAVERLVPHQHPGLEVEPDHGGELDIVIREGARRDLMPGGAAQDHSRAERLRNDGLGEGDQALDFLRTIMVEHVAGGSVIEPDPEHAGILGIGDDGDHDGAPPLPPPGVGRNRPLMKAKPATRFYGHDCSR
jgi:hypothetical protein